MKNKAKQRESRKQYTLLIRCALEEKKEEEKDVLPQRPGKREKKEEEKSSGEREWRADWKEGGIKPGQSSKRFRGD